MDNTVIQLPRYYIYDEKTFNGEIKPLLKDDFIWITIQEAGDKNKPSFLDKQDKIEANFFDLTDDILFKGEVLKAPTEDDIRPIVEFLKKHPNRDVLVNCAAGISRSGAVAAFLNDMGYYWPKTYRNTAIPNVVVLNLMRRIWNE